MFWKYTIFELKILLQNRKQLFLGLLLVFFFPVYFQIYFNSEPPTLLSQKHEEKEIQSIAVNVLPLDIRETEENEEIFYNLTEQLSLVNMQIFYLGNDYGQEVTEYIEDGLRLNELRMEMHEKDNPFLSSNLTIPIEEIEKENEFLTYLKKNDLLEEDNPFVTSKFLIAITEMLSGVFLFIIILLICSDMLVYENEHQTVMRSLPVSFRTKATSKITLNYIFIILCLTLGVVLGIFRSSSVESIGNFNYPTLIFSPDGFIAVPIMEYVLYASLAVIVAVLMTVCLTLLLNTFVPNMYGVVLVGIALFFLPDLLYLIGIKAKILYPIKYIDISGVLSGGLAEQFNDTGITYWNSIFAMLGFTVVLIVFIFVYNWLRFRKKRNNTDK